MNKRNSNIEVLRIIAIIMIIVSHYTVHSGINTYNLQIGLNRFILEIATLGNIGTVLFVLISGCFLVNDNNSTMKKTIKLWIEIAFYSIMIYIVFVILGIEKFSYLSLLKSIMPITFNEYWFATTYILLFIFHKYLNIIVNSLTRKAHLFLILLGFLIFSIINFCTLQRLYCNEFVQFIFFYIVGAYFGKYRNNFFSNNKTNYIVLTVMIIVLICSVIVLDLLGTKISYLVGHSTYFFSRMSPFVIILSISLLNIFLNKKFYINKFINKISQGVFAVYLISDNNYVRNILWSDLLHNQKYFNSNALILHMFISIVLIFIICIFIELIRIFIFEKLYKTYLNKWIENCNLFFIEKTNYLFKRINCDISK